MELLIIIPIALVALLVVFALLVRRWPQIASPLVHLVRKSKRGREWTDRQALRAAAQAEPEEMLEQIGPAAKPLVEALEGRSAEEREEVLQKAIDLQAAGKTQQAADILRQKRKTPEEMRAAAKKKDARRRKKKAARKQKRR